MKNEKYVFFWGGVYSNFYPCSFILDNVKYNCSEQYFMAQKSLYFNDKDAYDKIMKASTPMEQKKIGRTIKNFDPEIWGKVSKDIMYNGVYGKFSQNPNLLKELLSNGDKEYVEASPQDKIWGIGLRENDPRAWDKKHWLGTNWLGQTLDRVRKELTK